MDRNQVYENVTKIVKDLINGAKLPEMATRKCSKCGTELDLIDKEMGHGKICGSCYYGGLSTLVEEHPIVKGPR